MRLVNFPLSSATVAKLNILSVLNRTDQMKAVETLIEKEFEAKKPQILAFQDQMRRFQSFKAQAGIKRVYHRRKARKSKGK